MSDTIIPVPGGEGLGLDELDIGHVEPESISLNEDQEAALQSILTWLKSDAEQTEPYFVLEGPAGTGKTYCVRELPNRFKGRIVYTAPTNKATRELRKSVTSQHYRPKCRTIYSLLGLKLEANGEVKELAKPEEDVDLSEYRLVIVDEGSMINSNLRQWIKEVQERYDIKFLFMGDRYQLPPVGEIASPIWRIKNRAELTKVMRHDNQILANSIEIRHAVDVPFPKFNVVSNNALGEGVWSLTDSEFRKQIRARASEFQQPDKSKVVAWRNVTVDEFNRIIRGELFDNANANLWLPTDRVIYTSPAMDLDDKPMAITDDEGTVERVEVDTHPIYRDFKCYRITISMDQGKPTIARVLHPDDTRKYQDHLEHLAGEAKVNRRLWGKYWEFKEAFHSIRHAYAITAHRAQGSTYENTFVNWRDILLNRTRKEAFQCLYVAATRPKKQLILG